MSVGCTCLCSISIIVLFVEFCELFAFTPDVVVVVAVVVVVLNVVVVAVVVVVVV